MISLSTVTTWMTPSSPVAVCLPISFLCIVCGKAQKRKCSSARWMNTQKHSTHISRHAVFFSTHCGRQFPHIGLDLCFEWIVRKTKKYHKEGSDALATLSFHVLQSVHTNTSCFICIDLDGMLSIFAGLPLHTSLWVRRENSFRGCNFLSYKTDISVNKFPQYLKDS